MYGFFVKKLTAYSNNYVDWSNIAVLFKSGKHRYTTNELLIRGGIVATTAICAYLGANYNNEEKTKVSNTSASILLGLLGFTISHVAALAPLIQKRIMLSRECANITKDIDKRLNTLREPGEEFSHFENQVKAVVLQILTTTKDKSTQTWGYRQLLLSRAQENLNNDYPGILEFWRGGTTSIIDRLTNPAKQLLSPKPSF